MILIKHIVTIVTKVILNINNAINTVLKFSLSIKSHQKPGAAQLRNLTATSNPAKHAALAGKALSITGVTPL